MQPTQQEQFREAIANSVYCFLTYADIEVDQGANTSISGAEFLNAYSQEVGLNECDFFTAFFAQALGTLGEDPAHLIETVTSFWAKQFKATYQPAGLAELLAREPDYPPFLDGLIEFADLNPYDYYTANFIIKSESGHEELSHQVNQLWQLIFEQERAIKPGDLDLMNPESQIITRSTLHQL